MAAVIGSSTIPMAPRRGSPLARSSSDITTISPKSDDTTKSTELRIIPKSNSFTFKTRTKTYTVCRMPNSDKQCIRNTEGLIATLSLKNADKAKGDPIDPFDINTIKQVIKKGSDIYTVKWIDL